MASSDVPLPVDWELAKSSESRPDALRFSRIYADSLQHVYNFIRAQVHDASTAEELVGRIFLKTYQHRAKLPESDEEALFWILRTARTTLIDYFRVDGRREAVSVPIEELAIPPQFQGDPESQLLENQRRKILIQLINRFDADTREVLVLKFFAQRTNREIAAVLGISEGAVSMRLLRALRSLRAQMIEAGW